MGFYDWCNAQNHHDKPLSPQWAHWYRLMLSMHHDRYASGTINELR